MKSIRNTNVEIVRVLAMFLIFMHHMTYHGGASNWASSEFVEFIFRLLFNGGKVGITTFAFISGYYLIDSRFSYKKIFKLIIEMFIFSIGFFVMDLIMAPRTIDFWEFLKQIMPVTYETWWFMSAYLVLYFLSPYLNKLLKSINKREYIILLVVLFYIYCFSPTFLSSAPTYSNLMWFIFLYALAGFIRLYPLPSLKKLNFIYLLISVITYVGATVMTTFITETQFHAKFPISYVDMNSLAMLIVSVSIVMFAINAKPIYSKVVNYMCIGVMEVYLIHENPYFRKVLFDKIYDVSSINFGEKWWIYIIVGIIMFFSILIIGGFIRFIFNCSINKLIDKVCSLKQNNN